MNKISRHLLNCRGASAVEYALLAGLIAAVIVVGVTLLGLNLSGLYLKTANLFP